MWIAKPVQSLSESERFAWQQMEPHLPLSQTLFWANAIEAVSGQAYLVFSPDEKVGGVVFSTRDPITRRKRFECINGPFLNWDQKESASRQLATFAMAVSKLSQEFQSLSLRPRWESGYLDRRLQLLPIPAKSNSHAATLVVGLQKDQDTQFRSLTSRMRRTLSLTWKNQVETRWERLTPQLLSEFVPAMQDFGNRHGFTVPPQRWFEALVGPKSAPSGSATFWLGSSAKKEKNAELSRTQILICMMGQRAHYLFGYETRIPELRASISTSAAAHWEALLQCSTSGVLHYDLNGYLIDAEPTHPYYGVCRFKEQFAGNIVKYDIPEFMIE